jgi:hypothetical protein
MPSMSSVRLFSKRRIEAKACCRGYGVAARISTPAKFYSLVTLGMPRPLGNNYFRSESKLFCSTRNPCAINAVDDPLVAALAGAQPPDCAWAVGYVRVSLLSGTGSARAGDCSSSLPDVVGYSGTEDRSVPALESAPINVAVRSCLPSQRAVSK